MTLFHLLVVNQTGINFGHKTNQKWEFWLLQHDSHYLPMFLAAVILMARGDWTTTTIDNKVRKCQ